MSVKEKINSIRIFLILSIFLLAFSSFALAHAGDEEEINLGKALVEEKVPCNELSEVQLEAIGEYVMEQMHPGEAHELMDKMMGGEGSQQLTLTHIQMARQVYCNEATPFTGMMRYGYMMGQGGMMRMMFGSGAGMMGWGFGYGEWWMLLLLILLLALIILVVLWIVKLWKEVERKKRS